MATRTQAQAQPTNGNLDAIDESGESDYGDESSDDGDNIEIGTANDEPSEAAAAAVGIEYGDSGSGSDSDSSSDSGSGSDSEDIGAECLGACEYAASTGDFYGGFSSPHHAATAVLAAPDNLCAHCGVPRHELHACSRCHRARYCGQKCQQTHWSKGGHAGACIPASQPLPAALQCAWTHHVEGAGASCGDHDTHYFKNAAYGTRPWWLVSSIADSFASGAPEQRDAGGSSDEESGSSSDSDSDDHLGAEVGAEVGADAYGGRWRMFRRRNPFYYINRYRLGQYGYGYLGRVPFGWAWNPGSNCYFYRGLCLTPWQLQYLLAGIYARGIDRASAEEREAYMLDEAMRAQALTEAEFYEMTNTAPIAPIAPRAGLGFGIGIGGGSGGGGGFSAGFNVGL